MSLKDNQNHTQKGNQKKNQLEIIKKSATKLFAVKGYHNTSVADIIQDADIARGTFYNHFDGKLELFDAIIHDVLGSLNDSIRPIELGPGQDPILKQLRDNFSRLFHIIKQNPAVILSYANSSPGLENELYAKFRVFDKELIGMVSRSIRTGIEIGLVRKCDPTNAAHFIIGGILKFFVHRSIDYNDDYNINGLIDEILDFYTKGLMY